MMKTKMSLLKPVLSFMAACYLLINVASAQTGVSINTSGATADPSAILDVNSSTHGLLIPRVALTSTSDVTTISSPATSLLVYNTNASMSGGAIGFWYWDGTQWVQAIGPQGPAGSNGTDGADGATGATGPQGNAGTNGTDGADGAAGATGPQGIAGTNGTDGADGATGATGPQGTAGTNGTNGATGATGPTGAGFNPEYPDGFNNITPITWALNSNYTVPAGKTLYITSFFSAFNGVMSIDGKAIVGGFSNYGGYDNYLQQPIIVPAASVVSSSVGTAQKFNGFLVDQGVTVIVKNNLLASPYTVPAGKTLFITKLNMNVAYMHIDGKDIAYSWGGLAQPIIVAAGSVIDITDNGSVINGYLK